MQSRQKNELPVAVALETFPLEHFPPHPTLSSNGAKDGKQERIIFARHVRRRHGCAEVSGLSLIGP